MNPIVKPLWLNALRSDEFEQGTGVLRDDDNHYCCLGVLCELYSRHSGEVATWTKDNSWGQYNFLDEGETLPKEVRDWAGIESFSGDVFVEEKDTCLALLNDAGYSFDEIADIIEEQY